MKKIETNCRVAFIYTHILATHFPYVYAHIIDKSYKHLLFFLVISYSWYISMYVWNIRKAMSALFGIQINLFGVKVTCCICIRLIALVYAFSFDILFNIHTHVSVCLCVIFNNSICLYVGNKNLIFFSIYLFVFVFIIMIELAFKYACRFILCYSLTIIKWVKS